MCRPWRRAETVISGVASISLISPGMIEVAFYRAIELTDGSIERRIISRQIWDRVLWLTEIDRFTQGAHSFQGEVCPVHRSAAH
jgi:hypothetical protein